MSCVIHAATQTWCGLCEEEARAKAIPLAGLVEPLVATPADVNLELVKRATTAEARVAKLEAVCWNADKADRDRSAIVTGITDALGITGPHCGIDDDEVLDAVRVWLLANSEQLSQLTATCRALLALLRTSEFRTPQEQLVIREAKVMVGA